MKLRKCESEARTGGTRQKGARHLNGGSLPGMVESGGSRVEGGSTFGFEKLEVWQQAVQYASQIYALTKAFPSDERFGITSQLRRSAVSISANIAEGSSRSTGKDFARFVEIAYGSLMENVSETTIAAQQSLLSPSQFADLRTRADKLARMLSGLRSSILRKDS
jgi:four helix bundle protein